MRASLRVTAAPAVQLNMTAKYGQIRTGCEFAHIFVYYICLVRGRLTARPAGTAAPAVSIGTPDNRTRSKNSLKEELDHLLLQGSLIGVELYIMRIIVGFTLDGIDCRKSIISQRICRI